MACTMQGVIDALRSHANSLYRLSLRKQRYGSTGLQHEAVATMLKEATRCVLACKGTLW